MLVVGVPGVTLRSPPAIIVSPLAGFQNGSLAGLDDNENAEIRGSLRREISRLYGSSC